MDSKKEPNYTFYGEQLEELNEGNSKTKFHVFKSTMWN